MSKTLLSSGETGDGNRVTPYLVLSFATLIVSSVTIHKTYVIKHWGCLKSVSDRIYADKDHTRSCLRWTLWLSSPRPRSSRRSCAIAEAISWYLGSNDHAFTTGNIPGISRAVLCLFYFNLMFDNSERCPMMRAGLCGSC